MAVAVLAPAALAYRMDVPVWKQSDSRWASLHLGGGSYTMSSSGCAVTSCAMVAAYFGSKKDPGGLCRALNANGGLTSSGAIYWQKVPTAAGGTIRYIGRYSGCSLTRINQELDSGYPVIVEVRRKGNVHFVVVTGRTGSTYYINDPGYGDRTTLNARYGAPSSAIHSYRIYHGTHKAAAAPSPYTRYEQGSSLLAYTGAWTVSSSSSASGGSFRYANAAGALVTVAFNGTYLAWITQEERRLRHRQRHARRRGAGHRGPLQRHDRVAAEGMGNGRPSGRHAYGDDRLDRGQERRGHRHQRRGGRFRPAGKLGPGGPGGPGARGFADGPDPVAGCLDTG